MTGLNLPIPKNGLNAGKHPDRLSPEAFRDAVWLRDHGRSRASGLQLFRNHDSMTLRGEVCHLKGRRVMPEWATDPARALLLSGHEHWLSDGRGGRLLRLYDPETMDPATDASKPILFVLKDRHGRVVWERTR